MKNMYFFEVKLQETVLQGEATPAIEPVQPNIPIVQRPGEMIAGKNSLLGASEGTEEVTAHMEDEGEVSVSKQNAEEEQKRDSLIKEGEAKVIKQEVEEERKRKNFIRIRDQVATVIKEDDKVMCFSFPEANVGDISMKIGAQGFNFNRDKRMYFKRAKYDGDVTNAVSYEMVVGMVSIPLATFVTPLRLPEKLASGSGTRTTGRVHIFGPDTKYDIHGHDFPTFSKFGDSPTAQHAKLVK